MRKKWWVGLLLILALIVGAGLATARPVQAVDKMVWWRGDTSWLTPKTKAAITSYNTRTLQDDGSLGAAVVGSDKITDAASAYAAMTADKWPHFASMGMLYAVNPQTGKLWMSTDLPRNADDVFEAGTADTGTPAERVNEAIIGSVTDDHKVVITSDGPDSGLTMAQWQKTASYFSDDEGAVGFKTRRALYTLNTKTLPALPGKPQFRLIVTDYAPSGDKTLNKMAKRELAKMPAQQSKYKNGIILVIALEDHKWWLQAGVGVTGVINDTFRTTIATPQFTQLLKKNKDDQALALFASNTGKVMTENKRLIRSAGAVAFNPYKLPLFIGLAAVWAIVSFFVYQAGFFFKYRWVWRVMMLAAGVILTLVGTGDWPVLGIGLLLSGLIVLVQLPLRKWLPLQLYFVVRFGLWLLMFYPASWYFSRQEGADPHVWPGVVAATIVIWVLHAILRFGHTRGQAALTAPHLVERTPLLAAAQKAGIDIDPTQASVPMFSRQSPAKQVEIALGEYVRDHGASWLAEVKMQTPLPYFYLYDFSRLLINWTNSALLQLTSLDALAELAGQAAAGRRTETAVHYEPAFIAWGNAYDPATDGDTLTPVWQAFLGGVGDDTSLDAQAADIFTAIAAHLDDPTKAQSGYNDFPLWMRDYTRAETPPSSSSSDSSGGSFGGGGSSGGFGGSW
ncbi:TPM domain-containing protein [Lacticaseibacillus yichunensis]|uniref:TPM domain-containing protein n=1 Tax=Lacticaseibacillus yichunensis TaxID=2486015 RepID=A0ABW4CPW0_9LACO|nr:TPM domain-containing protein [Lacticaseibacillus yichunensis]